MKRLNTLLILSLALAMPAAESVAGESLGATPRARAVEFSDLDLSRPDDATQLYARIRKAAVYVCQPYESDSLSRWLAYRKCVRRSIAQAVADVNAPLLTQQVALSGGGILSRVESHLNR
jgi:UrcA family protein